MATTGRPAEPEMMQNEKEILEKTIIDSEMSISAIAAQVGVSHRKMWKTLR